MSPSETWGKGALAVKYPDFAADVEMGLILDSSVVVA
jgi:hypothetical protein